MKKRWSESKNEFLKENFMKMSNGELAKKLGVSEIAVITQLSRLGLCRSKQIKQKICKGNGNLFPESLDPDKKKLLSRFNKAYKLLVMQRFEEARIAFEKILNEASKELIILERARVYYSICCNLNN